MKWGAITAFLFCLVFIAPFILTLNFVSLDPVIQWNDFLWGFRNSFIQSFFAAATSILTGVLFARSLCFQATGKKTIKLLETVLLIPLFLPSLVVCLLLLILIEPFPFGNMGVIVAQVFIYSGLVGVTLAQTLRNRFSKSADIALVLGASQKLFWKGVVLPGLKRDLLVLFTLVFAACFSSFSIPLLMGGGKAENLEILIFDSIRNYGDWAGAILLMLVQLAFLSLFAYVVQKNQTSRTFEKVISTNQLFSTRVEFYVFIAALISFLVILLSLFADVFMSVSFTSLLRLDLLPLIGGTFLITGLSVLITFFLFLAFLYLSEVSFLNSFFASFFAPSTAIAALAMASFFGTSGGRSYFVIALVFSLFTYPVLYKLFWESHFQKIRKTWEVARSCGADSIMTVRYVLLPMVEGPLKKSLFLTTLWSSADFAISRVVATQEISLAMRIDRLLSSYYFENAFGVLLILIGINILFYLIFKGASRVVSQKS